MEMDKDKAVSRFIQHAGELARLPLVTHGAVRQLYGEEVTSALSVLHRFDREEKVCARCHGECCRDIGCELHAPEFGSCPIHEFRPMACRLHFCHRFDAAGRDLVLGLRDIFLGSLEASESRASDVSRALDTPPLARCLPEFAAAASPWVQAVREGHLSPRRAARLIRREARKHCTGLGNGRAIRTQTQSTPSAHTQYLTQHARTADYT